MSPASVCMLPTAVRIMSMREDTPTTASGPVSPPPSRWFPDAPKIVGLFKIMPLFIAFLYHSTLKCGMDGGFRLKEPEMEKCGSLIFGRLQLKLKMLFSLFTTPCTKDQTLLNTLVKVDLIPFKMLLTVDFTAFRPEETADLMEFTTVVIVVFMAFQAVDAAVFTALNTVVVTV